MAALMSLIIMVLPATAEIGKIAEISDCKGIILDHTVGNRSESDLNFSSGSGVRSQRVQVVTSSDYLALTAAEKADRLWSNCMEDTASASWPSIFNAAVR